MVFFIAFMSNERQEFYCPWEFEAWDLDIEKLVQSLLLNTKESQEEDSEHQSKDKCPCKINVSTRRDVLTTSYLASNITLWVFGKSFLILNGKSWKTLKNDVLYIIVPLVSVLSTRINLCNSSRLLSREHSNQQWLVSETYTPTLTKIIYFCKITYRNFYRYL